MKPKIFVSWSGEVSRVFAREFEGILRQLFEDSVETFISTNIRSGAGWLDQIRRGLQNATFGIVCVTQDNTRSEWLNFEAGAISNVVPSESESDTDTQSEPYIPVVPVLIGLSNEQLSQSPLRHFQTEAFLWDDSRKLKRILGEISDRITGDKRSAQERDNLFDKYWGDSRTKIQEAMRKEEHRRELDREATTEVASAALPVGPSAADEPTDNGWLEAMRANALIPLSEILTPFSDPTLALGFHVVHPTAGVGRICEVGPALAPDSQVTVKFGPAAYGVYRIASLYRTRFRPAAG